MSALGEEQRTNQYLERPTRSETTLDPNAPAARERWDAAHVSNHESLFSLSDNLTTLMFTVASDVSEAQREREKLTSSFSLLGMEITTCTFEGASTISVRQKLDGKPSLRVMSAA